MSENNEEKAYSMIKEAIHILNDFEKETKYRHPLMAKLMVRMKELE